MENPEPPTSPKLEDTDLKDGKIYVNLIYDMKKGTLSMQSGAPEIMVLGVLTQAVAMVGQKQVLKTLKDAQKRSILHKA